MTDGVGSLDPPVERLSGRGGQTPCDAGLSTRSELVLGSLGGGTMSSTSSTSIARYLVRDGDFGMIMKE